MGEDLLSPTWWGGFAPHPLDPLNLEGLRYPNPLMLGRFAPGPCEATSKMVDFPTPTDREINIGLGIALGRPWDDPGTTLGWPWDGPGMALGMALGTALGTALTALEIELASKVSKLLEVAGGQVNSSI